MVFSLRNALREIRNNRSFCLFYIVNLSLGLIGFIGVDSFKASLDQKVSNESKELLGADLALRTRRDFSTEEISLVSEILPKGTEELKAFDFFSMVSGPQGKSRLIKVVATSPGFPYYGKFKTKLGGSTSEKEESMLHQRPTAWVYPELRAQLDIEIGEELKLGEASFRVTDYVLEESGLRFQPAELAPKVFISTNFLDSTKLLAQGNTAFRNLLYKLPEGTDVSKLSFALERELSNPEIRVFSHEVVGHRAGRLLRYLSDFLSIVSMVALFLACLGSGYLYQGFINHRIKDMAILVSLGATKRKSLGPYFVQLFILGIIAVIPAGLICMLLVPILSGTLSSFVPVQVNAKLNIGSVGLAIVVATIGGWLIALPNFWRIRQLQPTQLFRESENAGISFYSKLSLLFSLPSILAFWILCLAQAESAKLANLFFLCLLGSVIVLYILVRFGLILIEKSFSKSNLQIRLATRSLSRNRTSTITGFLALGTGVLLINLIPQFQYILENEIGDSDKESRLPKLFLFDIQDHHLDQLHEILNAEGKKLSNLSPWIRGKLVSVKGEKYTARNEGEREIRSPQEERRNSFRNRGFNLSYRDHLIESEEIIKGRMVRSEYDHNSSEPAEISVASKYAESLDLDVGDRMEIEISGVPINCEVVNIRRVKWTSFQPNFFVQMQPGVLENAPKSYIGTLNDLNKEEKEKIQNLLVQKLPTISIVDIERTGKKILEIVSQMTWALQLMAVLSIIAGIIVLYSLAREKSRQQRRELNLLKILGASFSDLRMLVRIEFGLLALSASVLGILLSITTSYILAEKIFDRTWSFHPLLPLLVIAGVLMIALLVSEIATRKVLREKPVLLLGER